MELFDLCCWSGEKKQMNWVNLLLYIFHFRSPTSLFALLFVFGRGPGYTGIMPSLMLLGVSGSPLIGISHSTNSRVSHSWQEAEALGESR